METTDIAKRTKVRAVSNSPGTGPGPPILKGLCSKRIILARDAIARKRAKTAMRACVVMILRRSEAIS